MIAVRCPAVASGQRLVGERRITGLAHAQDGFVLTVRCYCGAEHEVRTGRPQPAAAGGAAAAA